MKRHLLLHAELSHVIATMGHGDMLVLGDAGLPIPVGPNAPQRIDLAVCPGTPGLEDVLRAVLSELQVQSTVIATEALDVGCAPAWYTNQLSLTPKTVSHEEFKKVCGTARAMVRTGECTPYANIILVSGVTF
ncbi:D-ribose pyranase [Rhodoferax sp. U2-2l]|uniref:D-ribose pyranase n=1 Tax=Rhodoferax sp. U2-2l TaxID=2884000 RepID=UPI001D09DC83|nr:D-ribose pyranase [Rhodoferax sp. U2-2l]MCB8745417.1 D-ribose pyranase [Rhodoferax sp. U2-2l]